MAAEDAGENAGGERRGEELAGVALMRRLLDEEVADGSFGKLVVLVEEEDFVEAVGTGDG